MSQSNVGLERVTVELGLRAEIGARLMFELCRMRGLAVEQHRVNAVVGGLGDFGVKFILTVVWHIEGNLDPRILAFAFKKAWSPGGVPRW